jgi:NAD(P)H-hydrate repair Nnr-like enzyme with NAD(P)H-hydrate dehydratase domain
MENNGVVTRVCLDEIAEFELEGWKNYKSTLGKIVVVKGKGKHIADTHGYIIPR